MIPTDWPTTIAVHTVRAKVQRSRVRRSRDRKREIKRIDTKRELHPQRQFIVNNSMTKRQAKKERESQKERELERKIDKVLPASATALRPVSVPSFDAVGAEAAAATSSDWTVHCAPSGDTRYMRMESPSLIPISSKRFLPSVKKRPLWIRLNSLLEMPGWLEFPSERANDRAFNGRRCLLRWTF